MKEKFLNPILMPPDPPSKRELDMEEFEQQALDLVRISYEPSQVFDLSEHDKSVSIPFAEYLSFYYVTVKTEEGFRHKRDGTFYTGSQVWDKYHSPEK